MAMLPTMLEQDRIRAGCRSVGALTPTEVRLAVWGARPPGHEVDAAARRSKTRLTTIAIIAITALPLVYATWVWVIGSQMD